ncbi:MAG: hypothetical protein WC052_02495 [Patescibacteria group bacterium]|jgi:cytochrome c oxidase subunit IV
MLEAIQSINWSVPSWDLFIALFFVASVFFYSFHVGRDRLVVLLIATYMALAVANAASQFGVLVSLTSAAEAHVSFQLSAFLGVFLFIFVTLSSSVLLNALTAGLQGSWWQVLIFGMLQAGLFMSIILSLLPTDLLASLSPVTRDLLVSGQARFVWVTVPIVALVLFERRSKS